MDNMISVDGGLKFHPTDEELITLYLFRKVVGRHLPLKGYVLEKDLYGHQEPWEVFEECSSSSVNSKESVKYFFTKLKKKSQNRIARSVGNGGTWHGGDNGTGNISIGKNTVIGHVKSFSYKKKGSDHNGRWLMKEYSLSEPMCSAIKKLVENNKVNEEYVLCRIKRKKDKKDPTVQEQL